jgi:hypothetical protein
MGDAVLQKEIFSPTYLQVRLLENIESFYLKCKRLDGFFIFFQACLKAPLPIGGCGDRTNAFPMARWSFSAMARRWLRLERERRLVKSYT